MRIFVITKNWGRNYTGATLATQYYAKEWINKGALIDVFTMNVGDGFTDSHLKLHVVNNLKSMIDCIREWRSKYKTKKIIGYSDDHFGFVFKYTGIDYIHTYHGNWPDAKRVDKKMWLKSHYFIPLYKKTIRNAKTVVNVSEYMKDFTDRYNTKSIVIHNGIDVKEEKKEKKHKSTYLMVGNVDDRKYGLLRRLVDALKKVDCPIMIDVYGKILDNKIVESVKMYDDVCFLGACDEVPYTKYMGLINVSKIENLSISVCEAIMKGIPVFSFAVGGLPEVVISGKTGFCIEKFDIIKMATMIKKYDSNPDFEVDNSVLSDFDWSIAGMKYLSLMEGNNV